MLKLDWYGLLFGISGNVALIPYDSIDITLRNDSQNTISEEGLEKLLLDTINENLPLLEQYNGVTFSARGDISTIKVDFTNIMGADRSDADADAILTEIEDRVKYYANAVRRDENGRLTNVSKMYQGSQMELSGATQFENGEYTLMVDSITWDGKFVSVIPM